MDPFLDASEVGIDALLPEASSETGCSSGMGGSGASARSFGEGE